MNLGIVSQCDAANCTYNHDQQCTAGALRITFALDVAQCYTYTEEPEQAKVVGIEVGDVSQCDTIDCTYNQGQKCMAETIIVTDLDDMARCVTYTL